MSERIGIIDCGTNTFHLMVVEVENEAVNFLIRKKQLVKIGEGGINDKIITPEACTRAVNTLGEFADELRQYSVRKTYAFATSAFRNARNGEDLKSQILEKTGIDIQIISGHKEAELIFSGATTAIPIKDKPVLVMDIGGGSVEFIIGTSQNIMWRESFEIGAQRLLDLFQKSDPIKIDELESLYDYLANQLIPLIDALHKYQPGYLIGSSGTFETLSEIYCEKNKLPYDGNAKEVPFSLEAFEDIFIEITQKDKAQRLLIPGMIPMRVDMIVVATALINFLITNYSFEGLRVSTFAMKEGALWELGLMGA